MPKGIEKIVDKLKKTKGVQYEYSIIPTESEIDELLPNKEIVVKALVYYDCDLKTAQYWASCGTAATIVQLRHLNPMRIVRLNAHRSNDPSNPNSKIADLYIDEISPAFINQTKNDFYFDGAGGRPKIDQAWLFAETRNSVAKLERILCNPKSKLKLISYPSINQKKVLEKTIETILSSNYLAYMTIDGAFQSDERYDFPANEDDWRIRVNRESSRKKPECTHWLIDFIKDEIKEKWDDQNGINDNIQDSKELERLLKKLLGCQTHAITITGVYEGGAILDENGKEKVLRLYRVLDSNPDLDFIISATKKQPQSQGTVRYMTLNELWGHTRWTAGEGATRKTNLYVWTTKKKGTGANKVHPFYWSEGRSIIMD